MRFYNLVQSKEVREYWEKNNINSGFEDQIRIVLRSYDTLENKMKYLEDLRELEGTDDSILTIDFIKDYYKKLLEEIYSKKEGVVKVFTIDRMDNFTSDPEKDFFDFYNNHKTSSDPFLSLEVLLDHYKDDLDLYFKNAWIDCTVIEDEKCTDNKVYSIFLIDGEISMICEYNNPEPTAEYLFDLVHGIYMYIGGPPLYPYENYTKVKIQTPIMYEPIIKYIYQTMDLGERGGTEYIHLLDYVGQLESGEQKGNIFIPENMFQQFYNLYDWIEEDKS